MSTIMSAKRRGAGRMTISSSRSKEKIALAVFSLIVMFLAAGSPLSIISQSFADEGAGMMRLSGADTPLGTITIPKDSVPVTVEKSMRNRDDNSPEAFFISLPALWGTAAEANFTDFSHAEVYMANACHCGISDPKIVQKRE